MVPVSLLRMWGSQLSEVPSVTGAGSPFLGSIGNDIEVSFEFFPPRTEKMQGQLWDSIAHLAPLRPRFVSVTYGADGSTRERTHDVVVSIKETTGLDVAAHLTCVGATRGEVDLVARRYWRGGIRHVVALRGDAPAGFGKYEPYPNGYPYACDLVEGLKRVGDFEISVAAYPETHVEAESAESDLDNLKRKIDAGANRAITQLFFDTDAFRRFMDRVLAAGITVPIVPGLLPITNFAQNVKFAGKCGASVPGWMYELFEGLDGEPATRQLVAATVTSEQIRQLTLDGIKEFHFYTLNRSDLSYAICRLLRICPEKQ